MIAIRQVTLAAAALAFTFVTATFAQAQQYQVDPNHHSVTFKIRHLGLSFVHGRFSDLKGTVNFDKNNPEKSTFELSVPASTINTANDQRDGHLKSADFFDVEKYPAITFKSTKVKFDDDDKDELEITGELTLKGVTRIVKIEMDIAGPNEKGHRGFTTELEIKRSDYGMSYGLPNAIGDKVELEINFEAIPATQADNN